MNIVLVTGNKMKKLTLEEVGFIIFKDIDTSSYLTMLTIGREVAHKFYFSRIEPMALGYTRNELNAIISWHLDTLVYTTNVH